MAERVAKYCAEHGSYQGGDFPESDCPDCPPQREAENNDRLRREAAIALEETLTARADRLRATLCRIAGVWPGEPGTEPKEDWRKTEARNALEEERND